MINVLVLLVVVVILGILDKVPLPKFLWDEAAKNAAEKKEMQYQILRKDRRDKKEVIK